MNLPFRSRIALFTATAAAVTIALVFFVVYGVVYWTAYNHLDEDIRQESEEIFSNLRMDEDNIIIASMPEWEEKEHQQVEVNPTFLQIVDKQGTLVFRSINLGKDILLFNPNVHKTTFFNTRIGDKRIRQGQFPITNEDQKVIGQLTIGISQEESALVLHNLRNTLGIAFPLLLIILFLATSVAAAKGIAPVQQLIRHTAGISETTINARLPLPENNDEIYHLATTINELLQRVESGMLREKQFTADASHEIRTPLTAIRGTLEVLIRKQREPAIYEEKIGKVIQIVDQLKGMLDQLFQLARLENGSIPIRNSSISLIDIIRACVEEYSQEITNKDIHLDLQIPANIQIQSDPTLLHLILINLIGNAVKYVQPNGHIQCKWLPQQSCLTIHDNGPGIPADQIAYIFDRFYRADASRSSTIPGAGLGLSIVKKLADLLTIRVLVESVEGQGSTFMLYFH
jgi:two-component system heavy metal sensor histidine kinase CusS